MQVEIWLQDWARKGTTAEVAARPRGPASSKWEVVDHFNAGLYTMARTVDVGPLATPVEGAGAAWSASEARGGETRPGDILVVSKGGMSRRTAYVIMRDVDGCRLQKIDLEADREPALPAFITGARVPVHAGA